MRAVISNTRVSGTLSASSSKSYAHRCLICSALSDNATEIYLKEMSEDIAASCLCLQALGAEIDHTHKGLTIQPIKTVHAEPMLNCMESGSTLRFMLPLAGVLGCGAKFVGKGSLPNRPISELLEAMAKNGAVFSSRSLPLGLSGKLRSGMFSLPGDVSSQYVSGLLMALPLLEGNSEIVLKTLLQSAAYVGITIQTLESFGVSVSQTPQGYSIPGGQRYHSPGNVYVEGDWSNSAAFLAAGALSGEITVKGLNLESIQGDKAIVELLTDFGAKVHRETDGVTIRRSELCAMDIDVSEIPDLVPILAVLGANARGKTTLYNGGRLRYKETDRLKTTALMINAMGGSAVWCSDRLEITGTGFTGGIVSTFGDHRIAMAAAIGGLCSQGTVGILDADSVAKSYPNFFEEMKALGFGIKLYD